MRAFFEAVSLRRGGARLSAICCLDSCRRSAVVLTDETCLRGKVKSRCSDQVCPIIESPELYGMWCYIIIEAEARGALDERESRQTDLGDGFLRSCSSKSQRWTLGRHALSRFLHAVSMASYG